MGGRGSGGGPGGGRLAGAGGAGGGAGGGGRRARSSSVDSTLLDAATRFARYEMSGKAFYRAAGGYTDSAIGKALGIPKSAVQAGRDTATARFDKAPPRRR